MEKLDNNIALVAQGEINKLDVRGGQLGARENLIYLLNNLTETSIIREFILKHINIGFELLATYSNGKIIINDNSNIQPWLSVKTSKYLPTVGGTYRFLQTKDGEMYIGSTANFNERITGHKRKFNSKSKTGVGPLHRGQLNHQETLLFSPWLRTR